MMFSVLIEIGKKDSVQTLCGIIWLMINLQSMSTAASYVLTPNFLLRIDATTVDSDCTTWT